MLPIETGIELPLDSGFCCPIFGFVTLLFSGVAVIEDLLFGSVQLKLPP